MLATLSYPKKERERERERESLVKPAVLLESSLCSGGTESKTIQGDQNTGNMHYVVCYTAHKLWTR